MGSNNEDLRYFSEGDLPLKKPCHLFGLVIYSCPVLIRNFSMWMLPCTKFIKFDAEEFTRMGAPLTWGKWIYFPVTPTYN